MKAWISDWFARIGLEIDPNGWTMLIIVAALVILAAWLANLVAKRVLLRGLRAFAGRTHAAWDDVLIANKVFTRIAHLILPLVIGAAAPELFPGLESGEPRAIATAIHRVIGVWMVIAGMRVISALLDAGVAIIQLKPANRDKPLRVYSQLAKILFGVAAAIVGVAILFDQSPWGLLTGLGAMTAVLLLVFRDTLLGLVASMQISTYDLVRPGDWLEMPQYGADGDVLDILLHTVRVQNWDKTITGIPTHAFLNHSFRNWRGMVESGGRRIKRGINVDMTSVRFLEPADIERMERVQALRGYLRDKAGELEGWNREKGVDDSSRVNGRHMTNLGTFRAYLAHYLRNHPSIRTDMTCMVRQLAPEPTGIPIQIYVFSGEQKWEIYEGIQADIFDHVLAVMPEFDLRVFQSPTGADLRALQPSG